MLEYKEAQVITFILILILLDRMPIVKQQITDGFQLMDVPMKLLKAKIMKEMPIKFIDGMMKNKSLMKQITGLILTITFINAIVGLMMLKLLMKQFRLQNAMEILSLSISPKTDTGLLEESTLFLLGNTEIVRSIGKMDFIQ